MLDTTTSGSHLLKLKISAIALHLCWIAFKVAGGIECASRTPCSAVPALRPVFAFRAHFVTLSLWKRPLSASGSGPTPGRLNTISKYKRFIPESVPSNLRSAGASFSLVWHARRFHEQSDTPWENYWAAQRSRPVPQIWTVIGQTPPPKTGSSAQDINAIIVDVTTPGVSTVVLRFDTADKLKVTGAEEIDFVVRYAVTAHSGYLALGQLKLLNANIVPGAFPGSLPKLVIEEVVTEAGRPEQLATLITGRVTPAAAQVIEPYESVEVATRITLSGQQSDTDPTQHDLVELKAFEQSFWRAQGTFTVNSVLDLHDGNMGDGIADTGLPNNPQAESRPFAPHWRRRTPIPSWMSSDSIYLETQCRSLSQTPLLGHSARSSP